MDQQDAATRIKRWIVFIIVALMAVDLVVVVSEGRWLGGFRILVIALLMLLATVVSDRLAVPVPSEIQVLALVFVFAALFLAGVRSYYDRIW